MLIDCPSCSRSYQLDGGELGDGGRTVICPCCDHRWLVGGAPRRGQARGTLAPSAGINARARTAAIKRMRRSPDPARSLRLGASLTAIGCLFVVLALIAARQPITRMVPRMDALYAAVGLAVDRDGLDFVKTATARRAAPSSDVIITGEIRNIAQRRIALPRLSYEIRDAAGLSLVKWTEAAPAKALGPGRTLTFSSLPHHLPAESRVALVTFDDDKGPAVPFVASGRADGDPAQVY